MVVLSTGSFSVFFNYECSVAVVSIIELTAFRHTLDGLILGLCASKYRFLCVILQYVILE